MRHGRLFGQPRRRRLDRREERRAEAILARLPRVEPPVEVRPYSREPFEADLVEAFDFFLPLRVGAEGLYADYDAVTGKQLGASYLRVVRPVRVAGRWRLGILQTGGNDFDGVFRLWWAGPHWYCPGRRPGVPRERFVGGAARPRHLPGDDRVRWLDAEHAEGPREGEALFAGYASVDVGGRRFDCIRLLGVWPNELTEDVERGVPVWSQLDDRYVTREGRTALLRRHETAEYHDWQRRSDREPAAEEWPAGRAHLSYNGIDFWHAFDILTDVALCPAGIPAVPRHTRRHVL